MKVNRYATGLCGRFVLLLALLPLLVSAARADSLLRAGVLAYLGGAPEEVVPVCRDAAELMRWAQMAADCTPRRVRTRVEITKVYPRTQTIWDGVPIVGISAGSWSGVVPMVWLIPIAPSGLEVTKQKGKEMRLWRNRQDEYGAGLSLEENAKVRVLRQVAPDGNADFYVEVMNGKHQGLRGWVILDFVDFWQE